MYRFLINSLCEATTVQQWQLSDYPKTFSSLPLCGDSEFIPSHVSTCRIWQFGLHLFVFPSKRKWIEM